MTTAFVFVAQAGELEAMACLLAASIREHSHNCELIAAIPHEWGEVSQRTLERLDDLDVQTAFITNPVSREYPIANKMACLAIPTSASRITFLDSDILCMSRPPVNVDGDIVCVPPRGQLLSREEWDRLYSHYALQMPDLRVNTTSGLVMDAPYVNSGMVSVRTEIAAKFARAWVDVSRYLWGLSLDDNKRYHVDQIAIPLAAAIIGADLRFEDVRWNYPSWARRLTDEPDPIFYHYQDPLRLLRDAQVAKVAVPLCRHPAVRQYQGFRFSVADRVRAVWRRVK